MTAARCCVAITLTNEEALRICKLLSRVDYGCPQCTRDALHAFAKEWPEFADMAETVYEGEIGNPWEGELYPGSPKNVRISKRT